MILIRNTKELRKHLENLLEMKKAEHRAALTDRRAPVGYKHQALGRMQGVEEVLLLVAEMERYQNEVDKQ